MNFPEVLIKGNVPNNLIQIEKYPAKIQELFDDLEVDTATEALSLLTTQISEQELKARWGGQTELVLPIGKTDYVALAKGIPVDSMNPQQTSYDANGVPQEMRFKPGEKVRLKRTISSVVSTISPEIAQQVVSSGKAESYLLFKNNGNLEAAKEEFIRTQGPLTLENILGDTWNSGQSLGVPTSYANAWDYAGQSASEQSLSIEYWIEVPAENIILVKYENGKIILPDGFDINRPDIDQFAFVDTDPDEGEITFVYEIPAQYIVKIEISPVAQPAPITGSAITGTAIALPAALDEKYVVNILFTADELRGELRARGFTDKEIDVLVDEWYKSLLIEAAKDSDSPLVGWMIQTSPQLTTEELINKIRENYGEYSGNSPLLGFVLGQPENAESAS